MKHVHVVAAVLENDGKYFIARRPLGRQLGGLWEFPGGKIEEGETHEQALKREMMEEFEAEIEVREHLVSQENLIEGRIITIHFYRAELIGDRLHPFEHEAIAWCSPSELNHYQLAPADSAVIPYL